ncbi:potassium channel family protein [Metabacillus iocasae]|uniref:Trk system potassium uptake protein TrkA n=1 Tax=Priestia iocasae TaxID=2291674 RepID=A0ABS2QUF0_9BACI|nr:TrkA family potassium uptake protein [Metabacillus iocasae]MBM7703040.1 trk system potassium uptake protein TrkA [Metabacillus iocasae]
MKKQFAVLGLGRFGGSLVEEFANLNVDVLAIDRDQEVINKFANLATYVVAANAIDETNLKGLGIRNVDHAIISFGDDIEASILATMLLKDMGVKKVWVKAVNAYHQKVLEKVGADRVIHPERDMARRLAHHVVSEKIIDYIELSKDYSIVEIVASRKLHNKTLFDLDIRAKYGCNIIGFQRKNGEMVISPTAHEVVEEGDMLIVVGHNKDLNRFEDEGV